MSLPNSLLRSSCMRSYFYWKHHLRRMSQTAKTLDTDPSWEAEILRHERDVDRLLKKGAEDLPKPNHEKLLENLPHVAFREEKLFQKDEKLLDETSNLILGSKSEKSNPVDNVDVTNIDPLMLRDDVREILERIHFRCNLEKVYRPPITKRKRMPDVKFYTDEQLQQDLEMVKENARKTIKMPLIMKERVQCDEVLAHDEVLNGYEESNITFVDISEDIPARERFMVVREPGGVLRKAYWEERDRLTQVYFPIPNRSIITPTLLQENNLETALGKNLHENVLSQCMAHFDPDSKDYIQTFELVYDDIHAKQLYSTLRSTRFYGGLVLHLVKKNSIDGLVQDMLGEETLDNVADLISLFTLVHPESKTSSAVQNLIEKNSMSLIKAFIDNDSGDIKAHSLALLKYEERAEKT